MVKMKLDDGRREYVIHYHLNQKFSYVYRAININVHRMLIDADMSTTKSCKNIMISTFLIFFIHKKNVIVVLISRMGTFCALYFSQI